MRIPSRLALALVLAGCSGSGGSSPASAGSPSADDSGTAPDGAGGVALLADAGNHDVPRASRPALRQPFVDPVFGTTVTRITDPSMLTAAPGKPVRGLRHEYSRYPAVNSDGTRVAVIALGGAEGGQFQVRDIATGSFLSSVPVSLDVEGSWHPEDPDLLFFRFKNEVRIFHAASGRAETVMAFPEYETIRTREEGRPSDDWRYFAFLGYPAGSDWPDVVVADLVEKRVTARWRPPSRPDWVGTSPSGDWVVCQFTDRMGTNVYRRMDLGYHRNLSPDASHSDFAVDADGQDILVYNGVDDGDVALLGGRAGIGAVRLADGARAMLLESDWAWGVHVSGIVSRAHPGWVLISTYNKVGDPQRPFGREVFFLATDGSGDVRRLAHHHSDMAFMGDTKDYWSEPQASSSWDGSKVVFASVWGQPFERYDLYMVTGHSLE